MTATSLNQLYKKHERWIPIVSFLLGFLFDMLMLKRIDELNVIIQQAVYLVISGYLIALDVAEHTGGQIQPPKFLTKIWKYREFLLHFLLGTLLNSYAIFYFKSASALTSFFFIALLIALLTVNEFMHFGKSQIQVHIAFLSLCLISYFVSLTPTLMGFIGTIPFAIAMLISLVVFFVYTNILKSKLLLQPRLIKTHFLYPFILIQIIFITLYFSHVIPPVPLSVKYMGIFHAVEKTEGHYELAFTRPDWEFWQNGDQTFYARPGDVIHCYAQVFSPTRFKDQLQVRWLFYDERRGWSSSNAIPIAVLGGREEGYRIVTKKNNFQPGQWRVQVETIDGHEIGRITFKVIADTNTDEREFHKLIKD